MITKEKAIEIAKKFLTDKNIDYVRLSNKVELQEEEIPFGIFKNEKRNIYSIAYFMEGYQNDILHDIVIDAEKGDVIFIMTPHRFIEPQDM